MQIHGPSESVTELPVHLNPGKDSPFAVITFGAAYVYVESADDAYKVIAAGIAALRLLDPDAPAQLASDVTAVAAPGACRSCGAVTGLVSGSGGTYCLDAKECADRRWAAKAGVPS